MSKSQRPFATLSARKTASILAALLVVAGRGAAQSSAAQTSAAVRPSDARDTASAISQAVRATRAPEIDGRDTDDVWQQAPLVDAFRVFDPVENGAPRFRTEARVAYDARHLYVFVRAFDPRPDSIVALLSRRDVRTPSDQLKIMVDSYHDRRTGYEFGVNPAGVKRDYSIYDDAAEDISWDAVWDVGTRIDSLGWTAEFRIPLSQLRFPARDEHTFGLMIMRDIGRTNERLAWPLYRRSRPGISSQFGVITGLRGLGSPRRLELAPYALTRNVSVVRPEGFVRAERQAFGADVKYGITSNLTLDLAVNPDFGQVEADPAQVNLTAFEAFFEERRPFFLEGTGIFQGGNGRTLFYSRRIGRAPQLSGLVRDPYAEVPAAATILGAAKLTGRFASGTSVGVLGAVTDRERVGSTLIEPRTGVAVARVAQDLRGGESGVGVMVTGLQRALGEPSVQARLREDAVTAGVDARHRWGRGRYALNGSLQASQVRGSPQAITRTQRSGVHFYQRPDDDLVVDTTLTSLAGTALNSSFRYRGAVMNVSSGYARTSPGFEPNDLGFLSRADVQSAFTEVLFRSRQPRAFWRNATATAFTSHRWTADGTSLNHGYNLWSQVQFKNQMNAFAEFIVDRLGGSVCDRCAFGGPAVRLSPAKTVLLEVDDDQRKRVAPGMNASWTVSDEGRSTYWQLQPQVRIRPAGNVTAQLGAVFERNDDDDQFLSTAGSPTGTRYLFARLEQRTLSLTGRLDYTIRPTLSLQLYAEPFVTAGRYANVRQLATARAEQYADRYQPWSGQAPDADFNVKQLRTNTVLRWEYRPGSTLFVVWSQGRNQNERDPGSFEPRRDYGNLFAARPDNVFLVKGSYWVSF